MSVTPKAITPTRTAEDMAELFRIFGAGPGDIPRATVISTDETPEPARTLLAHHDHMTVTLERHHGGLVSVEVLERRREGRHYSRRIRLTRAGDRAVVMWGIVRIDLAQCSPEVAAQILEEKTPLGRILIEHDVLRSITTHALLRIEPTGPMLRDFGLAQDDARPVYGRLATIFCNEEPAIDLLEIVAPEP